ncbi:MAG: SWIM zinc finger family protein, partial [Pseudobutyrivibrio sp.]|nr:SWIM zinc finger family protein [Pseudobutyrivibrio sp.]
KSTCTCPLANGKMVICKHIVAVSLCVDDSEAERFKTEKTIYASEEEERRAKKYDKYMSFARSMSAKELREAYVELMIELDEYRQKEKYGK